VNTAMNTAMRTDLCRVEAAMGAEAETVVEEAAETVAEEAAVEAGIPQEVAAGIPQEVAAAVAGTTLAPHRWCGPPHSPLPATCACANSRAAA
jgi:hypothetical protein